MAETFSEVILRWKVEKSSLTQAIAANNQVRAQIASVGDSASKSGAEIRAAFQPRTSEIFKTAMAGARMSIGDARKEAAALGAELSQAAAEARKITITPLPRQAQAGGGNTALTRADAADAGFSRISAVLGGLGQSDLANTAGLISDVSAGFKELPDVLGKTGLSLTSLIAIGAGAGIAIAGFTALISLVTAAVNAAADAEQKRIDLILLSADRQALLNRLIEEGNAGQIQNLVADAQQSFEAAQIGLEGLQAEAATLFETQAGIVRDFGDTFNVMGLEVNRQIEINAAAQQTQIEAMEEAQAAIQDYSAALPEATANMGDTTQAAQELAAAAQQAAQALAAATQAQLNVIRERVDSEIAYTRLANTASAESIQQRIDENNQRVALLHAEEESLRAAAEAGNEVAQQALPAVTQQIRELNDDTARLSGTILASAQAREQEAQAAKDSEEAARERAQTLSQVANLERQLRDNAANERRADARAERDFNRQRLREDLDFQAQLAQQEQEFNQSQLDAIKEAQEADIEARDNRLETEKDYSQREIERVKSFNERIADINRRASDEVGDAAGELDAKRVDAALRAKQQELADAVKENDKQAQENAQARDERLQQIEEERKERQSELAQRLADERQNFQEARAQQIADFNLRRQRENEDRAIRRGDELQDRNLRRQGLQQQIADLKNSIDQEKQIRRQGYAAMLADARNAFGQLGGSGKGNIGAGSSNGFGSPPPSSGGGSGGGLGTGGKSPVGGGTSTGFNGGGGTSGFNGGFSNPSVMSTNNNQSNQVTFNISNPDPNQTAIVVRQQLAAVLNKK